MQNTPIGQNSGSNSLPQANKLTFSKIPTSSINEWVDNGKIFLFQIYNKDFSSFSKGTPNMHTLYWKALFNEDNLSDVVYKLNGNAEVFFRRHSITVERPTHPANQPIKNKNAANLLGMQILCPIFKNKRF